MRTATGAARLTSAGEPDPIPREVRARWIKESARQVGDPTPGEIAARCALIRAGWDRATERSRRVGGGHVNPMPEWSPHHRRNRQPVA